MARGKDRNALNHFPSFENADNFNLLSPALDALDSYDTFALYTIDRKNLRLKLTGIYPCKKRAKRDTDKRSILPDRKVLEKIIQGRKAEIISVKDINRSSSGSSTKIHYMVFPLMQENHCLGCYAVVRRSKAPFTDKQFSEAGSLAPHASLIIQNITLLEQLNEKEEAVQALSELLSQAQCDLKRAELTVEKSLNTRRSFLARMNHELRTPINGVLGLTHLLLSHEHSIEHTEYLESIKTSGEQLLSLVNNILDVSDLETGKLCVEELEFNPRELAEAVQQKLLARVRKKNLPLKVMFRNLPEFVTGDPVLLNQILINLITNAIKFTSEGHITLQGELLTTEGDTAWLRFTVTDTGAGIQQDRLNTIFESFSAKDDLAKYSDGAGFGLHLVKQLTKIQNGSVSVKSTEGTGSEFSVVIPYKIHSRHENQLAELAPFNNVKILLAEDNLVNQVVAIRTLEKWNIHVTLATNGREALEKLKHQSFDMVIMDIQMPEMDGIEAASKIRKNFPEPVRNIPIMAMTACILSESIANFQKAGINDHLEKPFKPHDLYRKIMALLPAKGMHGWQKMK